MLLATAPSAPDAESTTAADPVVAGPRWYRTRIRTVGPLLALAVPLVLWAIERAGRDLLDGKLRVAWYIGLRAVAAPGLLVVGFPLGRSSLHPLGVAMSIPLWLAAGYAAARVATRNPVAQFRDYWRALAWFVGAVVVGVVAALVGVTVLRERSLLVGI